jgi:hypothetical protein
VKKLIWTRMNRNKLSKLERSGAAMRLLIPILVGGLAAPVLAQNDAAMRDRAASLRASSFAAGKPRPLNVPSRHLS